MLFSVTLLLCKLEVLSYRLGEREPHRGRRGVAAEAPRVPVLLSPCGCALAAPGILRRGGTPELR